MQCQIIKICSARRVELRRELAIEIFGVLEIEGRFKVRASS